MNQTESNWEKTLKIKTAGRDASSEDENHYPYEPTPYSVLERLADSGYLSKDSCLVDYGCGKGRVDFFLSWKLGCHTVGIEFDPLIYQMAEANRMTCHFPHLSEFRQISAQEYSIGCNADCFYFFNPFSLKILQSVIGQIQNSWYESPRNMKLFFYYPSDEYVSYLMTVNELDFVDEIDCQDLFQGNNHREVVLVFEVV